MLNAISSYGGASVSPVGDCSSSGSVRPAIVTVVDRQCATDWSLGIPHSVFHEGWIDDDICQQTSQQVKQRQDDDHGEHVERAS